MILNQYQRYQTGLTIGHLFPNLDGFCACGCKRKLPKNRRKWFSNECRDRAYIYFAILKGDTSIIREQLFGRDMGACRLCGLISDEWQADHITPVSMGGSACELSNIQTLCLDCHKEKTYNLLHQRAISWQASSIFRSRIFMEGGQHTILCPNRSIERHSFGFTKPFSIFGTIKSSANL